MAGVCGIVMKFYLEYQNRQLARMDDDDATLTAKDMAKLQKTADVEGISVAAARQLQKGYRYMV